LVAIFAFGVLATSVSAATYYYVKFVGTTNVRSSADSNTAILAKLPQGTKVEYVGQSGDWYKVNYPAVPGYKAGTGYIRIDMLSSSAPNEGKTITAIQDAILYDKAATSGKKLATIKKGGKAMVLDESTSWFKVDYKNSANQTFTGFVRKSDFSIGSSSSEPSPSPKPSPSPSPSSASTVKVFPRKFTAYDSQITLTGYKVGSKTITIYGTGWPTSTTNLPLKCTCKSGGKSYTGKAAPPSSGAMTFSFGTIKPTSITLINAETNKTIVTFNVKDVKQKK